MSTEAGQLHTPKATERWDEQGIPICQHCGGGSDFVKFHIDRDMPRIWYRCTLPQTAACLRDQSITCAQDFTRLRPLWETHEAYAILTEAHSEYERIHDLNRDRYRIGPDCFSPSPQADRRRLATTPRLRRGRHRMAPRLLPPRLDRQPRTPH